MSEYIPRLRQELVDAAARERAGQRRRLGVRPGRVALVLAAAVVAAAVVLAVQAIQVVDDDRPVVSLPAGTALSYRVTPAGPDADVAAQRSAEILRARIAAIGIEGATVSVAGDRVGVDAEGSDLAAIAALTVPGKLAIYDWETSVLGDDGGPEPGNAGVTGGPGAGQQATVTQDEAVARAAKADGGARVVQAPGAARGRYYALADLPALGNREVTRARAATDPRTGDPIVAFDFTARGRRAFESLTREIAHRGAAAHRPGDDPLLASQHLAIVLDDRVVSVPFIDFREVPDGIDGRRGAQIQGGLSSQRAKQIATILNTGPMPVTLTPDAP